MKILSIKNGFTADHSSTSYEFLAVDHPLDEKDKKEVGSLSSRAYPDRRTVSFIYNVEGYDIPCGWVPLMEDYYDVMYSESYDWWTFAIAFDASDEEIEKLKEYNFTGTNELGISIRVKENNRVISSFHCVLDQGHAISLLDNRRYDYYYDEDEDNLTNDNLLEFLRGIRELIMEGDYRAFDIFWLEYGRPLYTEEEIKTEDLPFNSELDLDSLPDNLKLLSEMITTI